MTHLPRSKSNLQGWYSTMLLVSLGVHTVLLLLPIPQQTQQQPKPQQSELSPVKITSLIAPKQSSTVVRQTSPAKSTPELSQWSRPENLLLMGTETTRPAQLPIRAIATPLPTPSPTPKAKVSPAPTSNQVSGLKQEIAPNLQTSIVASGSVTELFGDLSSRDRPSASSDPPVAPDLFTNPDLFFDLASLPAQPQLKPEILRATWVAAKTPTQVYVEILVKQGQSNNFQVSERGTYSQGTVYEVKQGENTWYFNLVPTRQTGTAIVVWKMDPSPPL